MFQQNQKKKNTCDNPFASQNGASEITKTRNTVITYPNNLQPNTLSPSVVWSVCPVAQHGRTGCKISIA